MIKRWIKSRLLGLALLALLFNSGWANVVVADDDDDDDALNYVAGQVIVKLDPLSGAGIVDINATYSTTTLDSLAAAAVYLLQIPAGADAVNVADDMEDDARLLFAGLNYFSETPEASGQDIWGWGQDIWGWGGFDSAPLSDQYALDMLRLPQAHTISLGQGAVVAVLDTGVQLDHPELLGSLSPIRADFIDGDSTPEDEANGLDDDGDGYIDEGVGHGAHIAGIIHLVAPEAKIMPVRILDSDGRGDMFKLIGAISYAVDNGADVINLSLGVSEGSDLLEMIVEDATRQGVIVVSAAGNMGNSVEQHPAANQCALGVTSVGANSAKSIFANYGEWIAFSAPGESIYSAYPGSNYAWGSGTSMATPFAAGQAALLHSLDPTLTAWDVGQLAAATAHPLDGANPDFSGELGAGLIDVAASLQYFLDYDVPVIDYGVMSSDCVAGD